MTIDWKKPIEFKSISRGWVPATVLSTSLPGSHPVAFWITSTLNEGIVRQCKLDGSYYSQTIVRNVPETKTVYQTHLEKKKTTTVTTTFKPEILIGADAKHIGHPGWKVVKINEVTIQAAA